MASPIDNSANHNARKKRVRERSRMPIPETGRGLGVGGEWGGAFVVGKGQCTFYG